MARRMNTGRCVIGAALVWLLGTGSSPPSQPAPAAAPSAVLATVGGVPVTEADIEEHFRGQMLRLRNQVYSVKKRAVDSLIDERLLATEADKRGLSRQELVQQEITDKAGAVTEADIEAFYKANAARLDNTPLDELRDRIAKQLQRTRQQRHRRAFLRELRKTAAITMRLKPPIVEVATDGAPAKGSAEAPVTVVEFADYECPYCARVQDTLNLILSTYQDQVRLVFKDFPLSSHPRAQKAAEAARCAGEQERYWDYHDVLFRNVEALEVEQLKQNAADLHLDTTRFNTCLDSGRQAAAVRRDVVQGSQLGVSGTPAFFINGRFLPGVQAFTAFQEAIDEALAAAQTE